jgi:DNA-binding XRE family transcriptional regulator
LIRRRRLGLTQAQAAKRWKIPAHIYARIENDDAEVQHKRTFGMPFAMLSGDERPKAHERCLIMRRRCKKTQTTVAKELGCSRYWLNQMELGKVSCDTLLWYWEQ